MWFIFLSLLGIFSLDARPRGSWSEPVLCREVQQNDETIRHEVRFVFPKFTAIDSLTHIGLRVERSLTRFKDSVFSYNNSDWLIEGTHWTASTSDPEIGLFSEQACKRAYPPLCNILGSELLTRVEDSNTIHSLRKIKEKISLRSIPFRVSRSVIKTEDDRKFLLTRRGLKETTSNETFSGGNCRSIISDWENAKNEYSKVVGVTCSKLRSFLIIKIEPGFHFTSLERIPGTQQKVRFRTTFNDIQYNGHVIEFHMGRFGKLGLSIQNGETSVAHSSRKIFYCWIDSPTKKHLDEPW